jgi:hypothetical protein
MARSAVSSVAISREEQTRSPRYISGSLNYTDDANFPSLLRQLNFMEKTPSARYLLLSVTAHHARRPRCIYIPLTWGKILSVPGRSLASIIYEYLALGYWHDRPVPLVYYHGKRL